MATISEPVFTRLLPSVKQLRPQANSLYITGVSVEERSRHTTNWEHSCSDVCFARLHSTDRSRARFQVDGLSVLISLRSSESVSRFLSAKSYSSYYLDVTGLPHHVWAPLLRVLCSRCESVFCVYVEPADYRQSEMPTESTLFDLSEKIEGISPLPGFASFPSVIEDDTLFVALLGFEGARFAHMLENLQPNRDQIFPVVGVPGFRAEYPFYTYVGNRAQLLETRSWQNVRFAAANCPFSLYYLLIELSERLPQRRMVVGMIGTKPHAIGAVLFHLRHPHRVELVYDFPVRKAQRTEGTSRVCLYDVSLLGIAQD